MRRTAFAVLLVFGAAGLLPACGGGGPSTERNWVDKPVADPTKKKPEASEDEAGVPDNERWAMIEEHFWRYSRRPISTQKDIFLSRMDLFVERTEIKTDADPDDPDAAPGPDEPVADPEEELDPLKKYPADEYKASIILTGTAKPSALIRDPKGGSHTVFIDTEIGNEHGVVVAITQYEVVVRQPNEPTPTRLSARPQVFELGIRQARVRDREEATTAEPLAEDTP